MREYLAAFGVCVSACTSTPTTVAGEPGVPWSFQAAAPTLHGESCRNTHARVQPQAITLKAEPIALGGVLEGFTYVGGWHLTSPESNFGGLSGLEMMPGGDLLAVSDQGIFFRIGLTNGNPNGKGDMALMRGANGRVLDGNSNTDAEGLVYQSGLALVSFERNHRILGFAYDACGATARGVELAALPDRIAGRVINENRGAEALSLSASGELTFGYETGGDGAPLGRLFTSGAARLTGDAGGPPGFAQVGRDELGGTVAELFRSYDPIRGNRNVIRIGKIEARMTKPMTVDNFEGIALQELPDGRTRIWIVSDDNFNERQRTLLMAFVVK